MSPELTSPELTSPEQNLHIFVARVTDKPGAIELISAAFAQRGVSLASVLGTDSTLGEGGHGKIVLSFFAPPAKKEVLRRAVQRLSRVQSLVEYPPDSPHLRTTALLRLSPDTPAPVLSAGNSGLVEKVADDPATGETVFLVVGAALTIDNLLRALSSAGQLRDVTRTTLAL